MKKLHRLFCAALASIIAAMALAGCATPEPDCARQDVFCVGLVTQVGKVSDESFNQLAWQALQQIPADPGTHIAYIESVDPRDYNKNIAAFADHAYDVIVTVGYAQTKATLDAAAKYPQIAFIGVDQFQVLDHRLPSNLATLSFPEDQAGFLAGALAAQMSKTGKIGAVCGPDWFSPAWRYGEGFKAGALHINPAIAVTVEYHNDLGFKDAIFDPKGDTLTTNTLLDKGADLVFGADGAETNAAVTAAAARGVYAIGVNTDEYLILGPERKVLLSSAVKLITPAVFDLVEAARTGAMPTGNIVGQVGLAPYHTSLSLIPNAVLSDGSLKTGVPASKPSASKP